MGKRVVKVILIGHGHLGRFHAQKTQLLDSCQLVGIVDPSVESWEELKKLYPLASLYKTLDEVDTEYDAALVCTPTSLHFEIVESLLEKRKHVFCEKPLIHDFSKGQRIVELLEQNKDLKLQVGHSERYHLCWQEGFFNQHLKSYFNSGHYFEFHRFGDFKPRARDVDVGSDLLIHDLDLVLFLLGEFPVELTANGEAIVGPHLDRLSIELKFESGKTALVHANRFSPAPRRQLFVSGSEGSVFIDLMNTSVQAHDKKGVGDLVKYEKRDHLLLEQKDFYQSILEDRSVAIGIDEGLRPLYLLETAFRSVEQKRTIKLEGQKLSHPCR